MYHIKHWDGLWRRGAGTLDDPDNGRLIFRIFGIGSIIYVNKLNNRTAKTRALYWILVRHYRYELCQHCGRPVYIVYYAPDEIWETVTGNSRSPGGEAGGGILCPRCLSDLSIEAGLPYLRWTCTTNDSVMNG